MPTKRIATGFWSSLQTIRPEEKGRGLFLIKQSHFLDPARTRSTILFHEFASRSRIIQQIIPEIATWNSNPKFQHRSAFTFSHPAQIDCRWGECVLKKRATIRWKARRREKEFTYCHGPFKSTFAPSLKESLRRDVTRGCSYRILSRDFTTVFESRVIREVRIDRDGMSERGILLRRTAPLFRAVQKCGRILKIYFGHWDELFLFFFLYPTYYCNKILNLLPFEEDRL